jgi:hypothetical protein
VPIIFSKLECFICQFNVFIDLSLDAIKMGGSPSLRASILNAMSLPVIVLDFSIISFTE